MPQSWHLQHKCKGQRDFEIETLSTNLSSPEQSDESTELTAADTWNGKDTNFVTQGKPEVYQGKQQSTRANSKPSKPKSTKANEVNQSNQSLSKTNLPFSASHFSRYNIRHLGWSRKVSKSPQTVLSDLVLHTSLDCVIGLAHGRHHSRSLLCIRLRQDIKSTAQGKQFPCRKPTCRGVARLARES